jgi:hypothetical protein
MRWSFATIFVFIFNISLAQRNTFQLWTEKGLKYKLNKEWDLSFEWSNRFAEYGLMTSFPQASIRFKVLDWLKTSVDYRWVLSKQDNGYYSAGNRINANIQGNYKVKRVDVGMRLRYQYSFSPFVGTNYDPEFDMAYRFRPSISYDIENSIISPSAQIEFFYTPENGPLGNRFTRIRYKIALDFETSLPIKFGVNYLYDNKINLPNTVNRHVINLSGTYQIKTKKSENPKKKARNINPRNL